MIPARLITVSMILLLVAGCGGGGPDCPQFGEAHYGPSAGCLAVVQERVLLVQMRSGKMTPPGGSALLGETAQCTAHRETWEETGLDLKPVELLDVLDTGFHLYRCEYHRGEGIPGSNDRDVQRVLWLPLADLAGVPWRFPGQGEMLLALIDELRVADAGLMDGD